MADDSYKLVSHGGIDWLLELQRHGRWLRSVLLARSREPEAVEELWQEVALAAVRNGATLTNRERAAPWLYRVAVRQALLFRRRCGRLRRLQRSACDRAASAASEQLEPLGWLLADERRRLVREALYSLPPRDAELLMLKYSENWSYREIAEHLGLSESAVEARLHRARRKLRAELSKRDLVEAPQ